MSKATIFLMAVALAVAMAAALLPVPQLAAAAAAARPFVGRSRFLQDSTPPGDPWPFNNCRNNESVCWAEGSPGPVCCNGVCVDTGTSRQHCGWCNSPCYDPHWDCCDGYCMNLQSDYEACGACGHYCEGSCSYGVCDYAG